MNRPTHASTVVQWGLVLVLGGALVVAIGAVRQTAPTSDVDFAIERVEELNQELNTAIERCERTLPDQAELPDTGSIRSLGQISSSAVVECPDLFDGQTVVYTGEVVGDILQRDGGAWLLVNDDPYAIEVGPAASSGELRGANSGLAVWLPDPWPEQLERAGGPGWRGDVIEVTGTIHRVDPDDGGGLTLRASSMRVIAESTPAGAPVNVAQAVLAAGLVAIVLLLAVIERRVAASR